MGVKGISPYSDSFRPGSATIPFARHGLPSRPFARFQSRDVRPATYFFTGAGAWFFAYGIQTVVFAWLVTIVLREPAEMVGIAQMSFLLPAMLLMLVGGSLADQYGGRTVALYAQLFATLTPLIPIVALMTGTFSYPVLLVYAVLMGCAQAIVTPARDGLLPLIADGQIQRYVVRVSMIQYGVQMLGFLAASQADTVGAVAIMTVQVFALALGVVAFSRLRVPVMTSNLGRTASISSQIAGSIIEGFHTVRRSPAMRMVVIQNCAMGVFFMGSYIVTLPLLLREVYDGSSEQLSWMNAANSLGLVSTILILMRFGDIRRQGRALLISQALGCFVLASAGAGLGFPLLAMSLFFWGMCGGIAITMARTIMQEQAPADQRARMMAFYAFSFMGSGPVGALVSGYMVSFLGPVNALLASCTMMLLVVCIVGIMSGLWRLEHVSLLPETQPEESTT